MPNLLDEATATFNEILRMHRLSAELLETLSVTTQYLRNYAEKHNIPLPDSSTFHSLLNKIEALIEEINTEVPTKYTYGIRRNFTPEKSDADLTEPVESIYKGGPRLPRATEVDHSPME